MELQICKRGVTKTLLLNADRPRALNARLFGLHVLFNPAGCDRATIGQHALSRVAHAGDSLDPARRAALQDLAHADWYPLYAFIRRQGPSPDKAADLTAVLCLVGSVFALLSRYAVFFWSQGLHQGPSLSLDARENMDNAFWFPLIITMAGFVLLFVCLVLVRTRTEIRLRRLAALLEVEAHA